MSETKTSPTKDTPQAFSQFLKDASKYLSAHENVRQHPQYATVSAGATQYVLTTELFRMGGALYDLHDEAEGKTRRSSQPIQLVSTALASFYNHELGYAYPKFADLERILNVHETTLLRNLKLLLEVGLWGKVSGRGSSRSRYYPLFSEKGMAEYLKVIEAAKDGVNPLTGKKAKGEDEQPVDMSPEAQATRVPAWAEPAEAPAVEAVREEEPAASVKPSEVPTPDGATQDPQYFSDGVPVPEDEPERYELAEYDTAYESEAHNEELTSTEASRPSSLPESRDNSHDDFNNPYYSTPEGASL